MDRLTDAKLHMILRTRRSDTERKFHIIKDKRMARRLQPWGGARVGIEWAQNNGVPYCILLHAEKRGPMMSNNWFEALTGMSCRLISSLLGKKDFFWPVDYSSMLRGTSYRLGDRGGIYQVVRSTHTTTSQRVGFESAPFYSVQVIIINRALLAGSSMLWS